MAPEIHNEQAQSVTGLVSGIVQDAHELLKQQFDLFKHEMHADFAKVKAGMQVLGLGAGIAFVGAILLSVALPLGLYSAFPNLPLWLAFAISGCLFVAVGAVLYWSGWVQLHAVNPLPDETGEAIKENVRWITNPK
jgi:protein-S-isoprenylcysteine O-methyltransferase Ste14